MLLPDAQRLESLSPYTRPYAIGRAFERRGGSSAFDIVHWLFPQSEDVLLAPCRTVLGQLPFPWASGDLELARAITRTDRRDVHVVLVGDGSGQSRLKAVAGADLGVRVHFTGRVGREQLGRYVVAMDVGSLPQSVDGVGAFRYTTKLSEYLAAGLPVVTGQLPFACDLGGGWLWRLPDDTPWSDTYVDALAALMTQIDASEVRQRRASVPHELPLFDEQLQRQRVTAFLGDVLKRVGPP